MIEISRAHPAVEKAIRYFVADKVVCEDFEKAVKLQAQGVKEIVTWDGTEFKQGMISGGQHKNIFSLNLGQLSLDRDIKKLSDEISILHAAL